MEAALILQAVNCPHIVKSFGCLLKDVCYQYLYVLHIQDHMISFVCHVTDISLLRSK